MTESTEAKPRAADVWALRLEAGRRAGRSMTDIAKEHGVSPNTVYQWARRLRSDPKDFRLSVAFAKVEPLAATDIQPSAPAAPLLADVGNVRFHLADLTQVNLLLAFAQAFGGGRP